MKEVENIKIDYQFSETNYKIPEKFDNFLNKETNTYAENLNYKSLVINYFKFLNERVFILKNSYVIFFAVISSAFVTIKLDWNFGFLFNNNFIIKKPIISYNPIFTMHFLQIIIFLFFIPFLAKYILHKKEPIIFYKIIPKTTHKEIKFGLFFISSFYILTLITYVSEIILRETPTINLFGMFISNFNLKIKIYNLFMFCIKQILFNFLFLRYFSLTCLSLLFNNISTKNKLFYLFFYKNILNNNFFKILLFYTVITIFPIVIFIPLVISSFLNKIVYFEMIQVVSIGYFILYMFLTISYNVYIYSMLRNKNSI